MKLLRAADRVWTAWKNGGGRTAELAVLPPGASLDDFGWRISIAEIAAGGPFSAFPGVERHFLLLEGAVRLSVESGPARLLNADSPALIFAGAARVEAEPIGGPATALNIMVRPAVFRVTVRRVAAGDAARVESPCMLTTAGTARIGGQPLRALDAVLLDGSDGGMDAHADEGWLHLASIGKGAE